MTQFAVRSEISGVLRAIFDRPPINLVHDETVAEVTALADRIESDPGVKVLVIDSANPDWFMARYDTHSSVISAAASARRTQGNGYRIRPREDCAPARRPLQRLRQRGRKALEHLPGDH
jgi:enoyl-CoA hydratase/carnithine racemase